MVKEDLSRERERDGKRRFKQRKRKKIDKGRITEDLGRERERR